MAPYTWTALLGWFVGSLIFYVIAVKMRFPIMSLLGPCVGIVGNHIIYELIGQFSSPRQLEDRNMQANEMERRHQQDLEAIEHMETDWISVKVYTSATQQMEYLRDRELLEQKGVRFTAVQSGITNLLVHPDDAASADEILGITRPNAEDN